MKVMFFSVDFSGEPAKNPECLRGFCFEQSDLEFEVGGATSGHQVRWRASKKGGLMDFLDYWFAAHIKWLLCLL